MRLPSIRIGLDDNGSVCVDDELACGPRMLGVPLPPRDCSTDRFDATATRLGELVLTLLMQQQELPDLPGSGTSASGPALLSTAHDLIHHSLEQRTSLHVRSIDCLADAMGDSAPERAFTQHVWPRMRERLLEFFEPQGLRMDGVNDASLGGLDPMDD
jgi:hypothetical protein